MYLSGFEVLAFLCENENDDVCDDEREKSHYDVPSLFLKGGGRSLELRA